MDGKSLNLREENIKQLNKIFPDVFSDGKIDLERLKDLVGASSFTQGEHYELTWIDKTKARQEIQKQTKATLKTDREGSIDFDTAQNVFIEGDNLEVLKILQKAYFGKVKMIYIDPPYNTGNDSFTYPDHFSETENEYLARAGDKDEDGFLNTSDKWYKNSKDSVTYHSAWLSMMYPRLYLARNLLREDGVIFISIDDHEQANLKLICDEIFGDENFLGNIIRSTGQTTGQDSGGLGTSFDFILAYSKQKVDLSGLPLTKEDLKRFENEDDKGKYAYDQMRKTGSNDRREDRPKLFYAVTAPDGGEVFPIAPVGYESRWRFEKKTYERLLNEGYILWKKTRRDGSEIWWPYVKYYLEGRTKRPSPLWDNLDGNKKASRDLRELFDGKKLFDFPKPTQMIQRLIQIVPNASKNDIVLDFFAGSSTTAQAVLELNEEDGENRKFIMIQIDENVEEDSEAKKAGYDTIADISKTRIKKAIEKLKKEREGKIKFEGKQELSWLSDNFCVLV